MLFQHGVNSACYTLKTSVTTLGDDLFSLYCVICLSFGFVCCLFKTDILLQRIFKSAMQMKGMWPKCFDITTSIMVFEERNGRLLCTFAHKPHSSQGNILLKWKRCALSVCRGEWKDRSILFFLCKKKTPTSDPHFTCPLFDQTMWTRGSSKTLTHPPTLLTTHCTVMLEGAVGLKTSPPSDKPLP